MPELPEIETLARNLQESLLGETFDEVVFYRNDLREVFDKKTIRKVLEGEKIQQITRRSKYLIMKTSQGEAAIHLGMSGQLILKDFTDPNAKHTHVVLKTKGDKHLHFLDPRRFGRFFAAKNLETHKFFSELGVEPLITENLGNYLFTESRSRSCPVKSFIMDASVVVGVGNIYASESLFRAKVHPLKSAQKVTKKQYEDLANAIQTTLELAISLGGSSIKDYKNGHGESGGFQNAFLVYDRQKQPCTKCKKPIRMERLSGRATYFCPSCQG